MGKKSAVADYREAVKAVRAVDAHHKEAMKLLRSFMKRKDTDHKQWLADALHKLRLVLYKKSGIKKGV